MKDQTMMPAQTKRASNDTSVSSIKKLAGRGLFAALLTAATLLQGGMARLSTCPARAALATDGRFVSVSDKGHINYSNDGKSWQAAMLPS
ncbi:MAG: hypothetical protein ACKOGK_02520, partial [Betaproteobacteria bacterium]